MRVRVVTAYVPLEVKHLTPEQYHEYADRLARAIPYHIQRLGDSVENCWLYKELTEKGVLDKLAPATEVPADRYATPRHMVLSNIVQHQRTTWMKLAAELDRTAEVIVWLDYAILKQGDFTGKPVREHHIQELVRRIEASTFEDIPFPGIWQKGPISDTDANWRFCGSTHIIPVKHLAMVDDFYKYECRKFIARTLTVPLDLPIWAAVEQNSTLPFHWYEANHDATQLTHFPYGKTDLDAERLRGSSAEVAAQRSV